MTTVRTTSLSATSNPSTRVRTTALSAVVAAVTVRTTEVYAQTTNVTARTTYLAAQYPSQDTPPMARAGNNQFVGAFETFLLDGSTSTQSDYPIASYAWNVVKSDPSLPDLTFSSSATTQTVRAPILDVAGTYTFTLTVTDTHGNIGQDAVAITVDKADVHTARSDNAWHPAGYLQATSTGWK